MKLAKWIWPHGGDGEDEYALFKDKFVLKSGASARIAISAADDYNLYINGRLAGFGQYPDYPHGKVYDEMHLSPFVREGENDVEIAVWHIGRSFSTVIKKPAGLAYEIYSGEEVVAFSRAGTPCAVHPRYVGGLKKVITPQLGYSYRYDMNAAAENYLPAVQVEGYKNLTPRPNQRAEMHGAVHAKPVDADKKIYDLGKESCGFLAIKFKAPKGTLIAVAYGEHLTDGCVRHKTGGRDFTVELVASGGDDEFLGSFRRLGCRYLQILGECEIEYIGLAPVSYPFIERPRASGNPLREKIYGVAVDTLKLCYHEHYEDCPWREQAMYLMDSYVQMRCGYKAFENAECARAAIESFILGQRESGLFELCFPAEVPITIPSFTLVFPATVREYYDATGDIKTVERAYPAAVRAVEYFTKRTDGNGLFKTVHAEGIWHFYEWADGLDGEFFKGEPLSDGYDLIINAYLSLALGELESLAKILKNGAADKYAAQKLQLNQNISRTFFEESTKLFKDRAEGQAFSALANSLAILCGACPEQYEGRVASRLAEGFDGWTPNTLSTNMFRFDALLKVDAKRYAKYVLEEIDGVYGAMLEAGATSFWETAKGESDFDGAGSLCHGWSAIPALYYNLLKNI